MKKICVKRDDGGVSIVIPSHVATIEKMERDAKRVEGYVSHREIEDSEIPSDRYFRNAWKDDGDKVGHDLPKCKEIKKDKMREIRKPLLEKLDIEYQRADEVKDEAKKAEIAAKKQALRDVTNLPLPDDIQQLKDFMPDVLKESE